jgi:hypothetical protein
MDTDVGRNEYANRILLQDGLRCPIRVLAS